MKLPLNGQWLVDQSTDRGLKILATKNINFDKRGYATLSNRTADVFDEANSASFRCPVAIYQNPASTKEVGTGNAPFSITIDALPLAITIDALANQPTGNGNSSQAYFNNKWAVSMNNDLRTYDGAAWTDEVVTLTSGVRHPMCVHKGNNTLLIGNGNQVKQFNTAISETTNLSLSAGIEVVGVAYNRNFACVITWDANNHEAWVYLWDGATAAANYAFPLGANRAWFVSGYETGFITINGLGEILGVDTSGVKRLYGLPASFTSAIMSDIDDRTDIAHDTSIVVDGRRIIFNIKAIAASRNSEPDKYNPLQPAGLWCIDPDIGLYHRHAPSGAKLSSQSIAAASVNTGTDVITATSAPATGTPFVYCSLDTNPIGGLSENTIYYVINTGATTFKVATTRARALAGTPIVDLTSAPSGFAYGFVFFPESDFGQSAADGYAGIVAKSGPQYVNQTTSFFTLFERYLYGYLDVPHNSVSDGTDTLGIVMDRSENRGYLITQKLFSPDITEKFQKLFVKARHLIGENDKVIVKYRTLTDPAMPVIARTSFPVDLKGTWTAADTFTTAADLSAALTAFTAGDKYEIEIITGAGAGYLAHILAISLNAGVYTVQIDETIRNISVNDTMYFVCDNWLKLSTKGNLGYIDSAADPNYSEFPIAKGSKWIQFKIELRGYLVAIEEYELVNTGEKGAA